MREKKRETFIEDNSYPETFPLQSFTNTVLVGSSAIILCVVQSLRSLGNISFKQQRFPGADLFSEACLTGLPDDRLSKQHNSHNSLWNA